MKILSYSLFCFILCFLDLCGDEESDCTKLEKEITVKIFSEIADYSRYACDETWAVDFYKDHCGGGPSGQMSYIHKGCYEYYDNLTYVQREGIGTWEITFRNEEDMLNVNVVDYLSNISSASISGKRIYEITEGGSTSLVIRVFLDPGEPVHTITFHKPISAGSL